VKPFHKKFEILEVKVGKDGATVKMQAICTTEWLRAHKFPVPRFDDIEDEKTGIKKIVTDGRIGTGGCSVAWLEFSHAESSLVLWKNIGCDITAAEVARKGSIPYLVLRIALLLGDALPICHYVGQVLDVDVSWSQQELLFGDGSDVTYDSRQASHEIWHFWRANRELEEALTGDGDTEVVTDLEGGDPRLRSINGRLQLVSAEEAAVLDAATAEAIAVQRWPISFTLNGRTATGSTAAEAIANRKAMGR
jgi:hypothetical protein